MRLRDSFSWFTRSPSRVRSPAKAEGRRSFSACCSPLGLACFSVEPCPANQCFQYINKSCVQLTREMYLKKHPSAEYTLLDIFAAEQGHHLKGSIPCDNGYADRKR